MPDDTTDHAAAIRKILHGPLMSVDLRNDENTTISVEGLRSIRRNTDALDAQLAKSEARCERWKRYFTALDRNGQLEDRCEPWDSEESLAVHRELKDAGEELVKHGDLDPQEGS